MRLITKRCQKCNAIVQHIQSHCHACKKKIQK